MRAARRSRAVSLLTTLTMVATVPGWGWPDRALAQPPAAETNTVAVLPLEIVGNVPAGRPALETAVTRGLTVFSGPTIEATHASAKLTAAKAKLPCADAECWTAAGKTLGARYLVAGQVER